MTQVGGNKPRAGGNRNAYLGGRKQEMILGKATCRNRGRGPETAASICVNRPGDLERRSFISGNGEIEELTKNHDRVRID